MVVVEGLAGLHRSHGCGELTAADAGKEVTLMGWVHRRRDHGGLIFIDLRDRSGLVQVVCDPKSGPAFQKAEEVRNEYVVAVRGLVRRRPEGTVNPKLPTGEIEVVAEEFRLLNRAKTPPFYIDDGIDVDEALRLRYRYLDLRRPEMQRLLYLRYRTTRAIRDFLDARGFWEIETPMLTRSTPEGARDFLVPSRLRPGEFFALPQSPQLFKQILMVAGVERYFQIVRCFRDEDLRADRQPEFTQLDMEMSFVQREDILKLVEELMAYVFRETLGVELALPLPRLTYREAMDRYGSDKPDIRFGMEIVDVSDLVAGCGFKVFAEAVARGGVVRGLCAPGCAGYSRRELDELTRQAAVFGAKGLAWMAVTPEGIRSPIAKFFTSGELEGLVARLAGKPGDLLLFVADTETTAATALGALRLEMGRRLHLYDPEQLAFTWVTEFPLLEYSAEEKRYVAVHHPFTMPMEEDWPLLDSDPLRVRALAYDLVLNGVELGGGSIRIHRRDIQEKMFNLLGFTPEAARDKFGFLLDAFEYGTPPHGGIAFGLDRMLMLMARRDTIRDCIPFPKTQSGTCLMTAAPSGVSPEQLQELHLRSTARKSTNPA
ncbi:aspartate--tRNA ligase [Neomoorella thermoacetica]|uniref:Aspartate--tRNA(Asp/Asn) ligase n=1 Tax=Moorella thermoacetica (strain ATCC 39073 / JCM 9320) TaxID=264732 RepID=SYDND_MOOTA|nr:aspartate--tRNA ligase [Moorella thermoacetica]Q2RHW1.1 RecName: Full=Aspartate--tRNA(Asp/Asn) ligase; AltName: Full=Aspartyl-tRNA synthetase; Short=AspRS; AltName: Full=Non-discriminating aspartyl-tRNA synthetase; Short=ND-AspRS [Moorella thermoacetica ATCC 39073]AKX94476.1 aspartate--tRNA ligase [Moorella thermoacetica]AKX97112.1 aspartate--tRNA ligase [Moorella thermoacetica]OIQ55183.1 aspartate--tRNA ligase [Moorella thermoacetica]OIQ57469.1 aspartate--tRNA ligase [Moorella thermoacetic